MRYVLGVTYSVLRVTCYVLRATFYLLCVMCVLSETCCGCSVRVHMRMRTCMFLQMITYVFERVLD